MPTSLAFWGRVLPLHHIGAMMSPLSPCLPVYVASCLRGQYRLLHSSPWNCKYFNACTYIHTDNDLTQDRFNDGTVHSLCRIMVRATSVMGLMKMGNTVPRGGLECTFLVFRANALPLHQIVSLMSPLCPCLPIYAAPCLRGQSRLLQY